MHIFTNLLRTGPRYKVGQMIKNPDLAATFELLAKKGVDEFYTVCVCVYMYVCKHVCMYVCCMYVCMHACTYACMYVRTYIYTLVCLHIHKGAPARAIVYICI